MTENHPRVVNVYSGQHYDVYVGRGAPPGRYGVRQLADHVLSSHSWGNPFVIGKAGRSRASAIAAHRVHVLERPWLIDKIRAELRRKVLGCFCHPQPCHASTLAWIADTVPVAHVQWDCKRDGHCKQGDLCQFCDGGLASCSRCKGFEGALTSECPGVAYDQDKVYAGTLNYVCGEWTQGSVDKDGRRNMPFWCGKVHWGDAELLATSREWKTADQ